MENDKKSGAAVTLPIEVEAADDAKDAVKIEIDVPTGGAKVEIPVEVVTPGTVAIIVHADGTEEVIKTSVVTETGVVITLEKDAEMTIFIQYDSEGTWRRVKHLTATKKQSFSYPVLVRRCDHYRIRIEGKGYWELHSMAREFYVGSGVH